MNREQKIEAVDEIAEQIEQSQAVFAIDYRGITVSEIASVRAQLGEADASFRVVKNSLTELAADKAGAEHLKTLLEGPTALTFVRGDAAAAAKAIATFNRETDLLPFKGGIMDGEPLEVEQIKIIARLPFVERADHPAALPVFVISRVADDAKATEAEVWSVRVSGWSAEAAQTLTAMVDFLAVPDRAFDGAALLVTLPKDETLAGISQALVKAGATVRSTALVGSHATRYTVAAEKSD